MALANIVASRNQIRRIVQTEAGAWGVMATINAAFIQPLLIARGASQIVLGLYISGSSLFNFGAGWVGPTVATRIGNMARATMALLTFSRVMFLAFTGYLLLSDNARPAILIPLILLWGLGEGLALPLWTSFLAGMVHGSERGRWVAMRAQAATLLTVPVLAGILVIVVLASKERALPFAYAVAGSGAVLSWFTMRRMFAASAEQAVPPKRALTHVPESPEARRFLTGVFMFWFASALTWPIVPKYIMTDLHAPTAYFAVSQIVGAMIGVVIQPWWGRKNDSGGAARILLISGIGSALVPLMWALAPHYWLGFGIDALAFWSGPGTCWA